MTEHINTKATRLPPATYGGFVGKAAIDPGYAVKVKATDTVVDIRDFSPADGTLNLRDRSAASALRNFRRWDTEHRLMRQANIPASDVIYLPNNGTIVNGMIAAQITAYKKHMIGADDATLVGNALKLKKTLTVRAVYSASTSAGQTIFKTVEIDPTTCVLHDSSNAVIEEFDPKYNCIELNNLQLEIPADVILKHAPQEMVSAIQTYQNANGWNGFFSFIKKAFNYVKKKKDAIKQAVSYVKQGVGIIKLFTGNDGKPIRCEGYIVNNLDDLMAARQNDLPDELRKLLTSCVSPQAGTAISREGDLFEGTTAARNGYTINDVDIVRCRNFTDVCRHSGFNSIEAMFAAERNTVQYEVIPFISHGLGDLYDGELTPVELAPGDIDYRDKIYPVDPVDLAVESMDATGIGGKKSVAGTAFDPDDTDPESEFTTGAEFTDDYSIGNSIPRKLVWELDPDFVESGGTMETVGRYLQGTEFDFSRIRLYLEDDAGFRVQCNRSAVSIYNFDTSIGDESSTATLKFFGQGTAQLTADFPYYVEPASKPIKTLLSATTTKQVMVGTQIDPSWLVNVVSDSELTDEGYKNAGTLLANSYTTVPARGSRLNEVGVTDVTVNVHNVSSTVQFEVVDITRGDTVTAEEINARYKFTGWLNNKNNKMVAGAHPTKADVMFSIVDTYTNLPVYYGSAYTPGIGSFVEAVYLNDAVMPSPSENPQPQVSLAVGTNVIRLVTAIEGLEWKFTHIAPADVYGVTAAIDDESESVVDGTYINLFNIPQETEILTGKVISGSGGLTPADLVVGAHVRNGNGAYVTVRPGQYGLEAIMPFEYEFADPEGWESGERMVGVATVRPCNLQMRLGQYSSAMDVGRVGEVKWLVLRPVNDGSEYTFTINDIVKGKVAEGYEVLRNSYVDLSKINVILQYFIQKDGEDYSVNSVWIPGTAFKWTDDGTSTSPVAKEVWVDKEDASDPFIISTHFATEEGGEEGNYGFQIPISSHSLESIEAELIGNFEKDHDGVYQVPYGTPITPDSMKVQGVLDDDSRKELTDHIHIFNYFPRLIGEQEVIVFYGDPEDDDVEKQFKILVRVNVLTPTFTDLRARAKTRQFKHGQALTAADFDVTAITTDGHEVPVAENDVEVIEFNTSGAENQTGMTAIRYIGDADDSATRCTGTYRYDTGLGGGNTEFGLPALVAPYSRPYCFKGDITRDFGLTSPFMVAPDNGDRTPVDPQLITMDPVDTSQAGTVEVPVYLRESNWRVCRK